MVTLLGERCQKSDGVQWQGGSTMVQQVMSDVLHDWPLSPFARHWWWVLLDIVFSPPCPSVMRSASRHGLWPPGHWWFRLKSKLALLLVVASYEFRSAYISAPLNSKLFLRQWKRYNQHKWLNYIYNHGSLWLFDYIYIKCEPTDRDDFKNLSPS